jgi:23S rRNA-/tRNA-specific pseudouridylate synthase
MAKHINSIVITEIESNTRLDRYLVNSLNIPQGLVQKDLRKGLIRVNEKKISGSYRIKKKI